MSIRSLRGRISRLTPLARPVIGQDRHRDRRRRDELSLRKDRGLTAAEQAEFTKLNSSLAAEDRDKKRMSELCFEIWPFSEAEQSEYLELSERYPPDPNDPFKEIMDHFATVKRPQGWAHSSAGRAGAERFTTEPERDRDSSGVHTVASEQGFPDCQRATSKDEKLTHASQAILSDAELLQQLILAANHNVVPGERIEDVGPVKVMLESGIELDDVLYTLRGKVDPRTDPRNKALASWSEHRFVKAVAEEYGRRVILPVLAQKLGRKA